MKYEIPPSTTTAPIAIARTLLPLSPPPELVVVVSGEVGGGAAGVVVVGMVAWGCGRPGLKGVPGP
jgi:hypothetical protein